MENDNSLVPSGIPLTSNAGGAVEQRATPCHEKSIAIGARLALSGAAQPLVSNITPAMIEDFRMFGPF